jgi:hypothetical protein
MLLKISETLRLMVSPRSLSPGRWTISRAMLRVGPRQWSPSSFLTNLRLMLIYYLSLKVAGKEIDQTPYWRLEARFGNSPSQVPS